MGISFPTTPNGHQFEAAVAAKIRSIGYFTENRQILSHEGHEILELDVVASAASNDFSNRILIDAKKETTGFSDVFKIFGWRTYLKIPKGCIVHGKPHDEKLQADLHDLSPKLEVHSDYYDFNDDKDTVFNTIPIINSSADSRLRKAAANVGWYHHIAERLALDDFNKIKKLHPHDGLLKSVKEYARACHSAFFEHDPLKRASKLYEAFRSEAHISDSCVHWEAKRINSQHKTVWEEVRDSKSHLWIQYVVALETRARLLIIKNAVEASFQYNPDGNSMQQFQQALVGMPTNFITGCQVLCNSVHRSSIPYILQMYLEVFGGFWVENTDDQKHLSELANVPLAVVGEALAVYGHFFPIDKGWHTQSKEIHLMKMVPAYIRGIGCFMRLATTSQKDYDKLCPKMAFLACKWHNSTIAVLELEVPSKESQTTPKKTKD